METPLIEVSDVSVFYGDRQVVFNASFEVKKNTVFALIGTSGSGKTTLLKILSRLIDLDDLALVTGNIRFEGRDIFSPSIDVHTHRKNMIYIGQSPDVFDLSVKDNLSIPLKYWKPNLSESDIESRVIEALGTVNLWKQLKNRLEANARTLSAGEKQRLCIARALLLEPKVLLCDEPTAHMDRISAERIEEIFDDLRNRTTVLIVTHSLTQSARISQEIAFLDMGVVRESGETSAIFTNPRHQLTQDFITGRFG